MRGTFVPFKSGAPRRIVELAPNGPDEPTMERALTLHFVDGTKISFDFDEQAANVHARKVKLDDFLAGQHLVVEAEGSVLIFPVANIKYMAFATPLMDTKSITAALPRHTIVQARIRT